jgi:threonine 3-dehydrogenase
MVQKELTIPSYMYRVVYRELILTGIFGRNMFRTWEPLLNMLETGRIDLRAYVGDKVSMWDYQKAIDIFDALNGRAILIP